MLHRVENRHVLGSTFDIANAKLRFDRESFAAQEKAAWRRFREGRY